MFPKFAPWYDVIVTLLKTPNAISEGSILILILNTSFGFESPSK